MSEDKTGGPAYPYVQIAQPECQDGTWNQTWEPGELGMTWLDKCAMEAMTAMLLTRKLKEPDVTLPVSTEEFERQYDVAKPAYKYARAMLAEKRRIESEVAGG